jgi:hypothetical protein
MGGHVGCLPDCPTTPVDSPPTTRWLLLLRSPGVEGCLITPTCGTDLKRRSTR